MQIQHMALALFLLLCVVNSIDAQVYLQIEKANSLKTFKFYQGDLIHFRTVLYPNDWRSETLDQILYEDKTFVLGGELYKIEDIKDIRKNRSWAHATRRLAQAGFMYAIYGAIVQLTGLYDIGKENYIIAGTAIGLGTIIPRLFGWRKFKLGKKYRLRILVILSVHLRLIQNLLQKNTLQCLQ